MGKRTCNGLRCWYRDLDKASKWGGPPWRGGVRGGVEHLFMKTGFFHVVERMC